MKKLFGNEDGSIVAYVAIFAAMALASGALAIDFGRLGVLRTQMQNHADAAALSGAVQLDMRDGARARATEVATDAAESWSAIPATDFELQIAEVNFYSEIEPAYVTATTDLTARFIEVVLEPRTANLFFEPLTRMFGGEGDGLTTLEARAVAKPSAFICEAPPMMACDLAEEDPSQDFALPQNIGKQLKLKAPQAGGGPWRPGNFGLLSLPDGSAGADDIEDALAAVEPEDCYTLDVQTAEGSKTNKVKRGINARFDLPGGPPTAPAPDVIGYPRDDEFAADPDAKMGSGNWHPENYWPDKHNGAPLPPALAGASRYQVYLYELGLEFARNGWQTVYPITGSVPAGFTVVTPPGANIPQTLNPMGDDDGDGLKNKDDPDHDGMPSQPPAGNGYERRILKVAVLRCIADDIRGLGIYPTHGNFIDVFVTEPVENPSTAGIYAEIVRPLSQTYEPDFYANVRLVR
jgi:hypothetical protein